MHVVKIHHRYHPGGSTSHHLAVIDDKETVNKTVASASSVKHFSKRLDFKPAEKSHWDDLISPVHGGH